MNVLVMRFSALGDVAMLSPVVREYALQHTEDSVTVLSVPFCAPLFEDIAPNVSFLGRDVKTQYRGVTGLYRLFKELHAMHFDRIVDAHDVLRTKVLRQFFRLRGYEVRVIDKHRSERRRLTAEPGKKVLQQLPTSFENYAEAMGIPGVPAVPAVPADPVFPVSPDIPDTPVSPGGGLIGVAPFAAHEGKIYPTDKMEKVVEMLSHSGRVVLFGGKGKEEDVMRAWARKYNNVELARDVISGGALAAELELMRGLDVMLSMDSANMHLASLTGIPVVSIWGATHPFAGFMGWNQTKDNAVQADLDCRPCSIFGQKPCKRGDYACMNMIKPETVVEKINTLLQTKQNN